MILDKMWILIITIAFFAGEKQINMSSELKQLAISAGIKVLENDGLENLPDISSGANLKAVNSREADIHKSVSDDLGEYDLNFGNSQIFIKFSLLQTPLKIVYLPDQPISLN